MTKYIHTVSLTFQTDDGRASFDQLVEDFEGNRGATVLNIFEYIKEMPATMVQTLQKVEEEFKAAKAGRRVIDIPTAEWQRILEKRASARIAALAATE